jgi:ribosomal protein S18 acetylase RimI-like enzyme
MGPGFSIRPARAEEMPTVAALFRAYAIGLDVDLSYQGFAAELAGLPGAYATPAGALLLAVSADERPLGCVAMRPLPALGGCEMKRLYVGEAGRGLGIGRALAIACIRAAIDAGYSHMLLDTLPQMSAAQQLYGQLGFEIVPPYYDTPVPGTIFMRKTLKSCDHSI